MLKPSAAQYLRSITGIVIHSLTRRVCIVTVQNIAAEAVNGFPRAGAALGLLFNEIVSQTEHAIEFLASRTSKL